MSDDSFFRLGWDDYGILIEDAWKDLKKKLEDNNVKIDAVVAILREGGFTALPLAYRLNTYKVITIQFKYMLYDGSHELKYIAGMQDVEYNLPEEPVFLLCDTFPCGGKTKRLAIDKIRDKYPKAKFVFVSLAQDKTTENDKDFILSAHAFDLNDKWETTHPVFKKYGIEKKALDIAFPWSNIGEEDASVNEKEWRYN